LNDHDKNANEKREEIKKKLTANEAKFTPTKKNLKKTKPFSIMSLIISTKSTRDWQDSNTISIENEDPPPD